VSQGETPAAPDALGSDGVVSIIILLVAATDPRVCGDSSASLLVFRVLWWVLYVTAAIKLVQRQGVDWLRWIVAHQPALCVLVALAFASCVWSLEPLLTLHRAASLLSTTLLGVFIGFSRGPDAIMRALQWAFAILIIASMAVAVGGYAPPPDPRGWAGIMGNKNSLGAAAELATVFFVVVTVTGRIHPFSGAALSIASLITTVYAYSRTALIALGITVAVGAYLFVVRNRQRLTRAAVRRTAWILALGPPALAMLVVPLARLIRERHALSGRGPLWAGVLAILKERPFTGYGYGAVWGKAKHTLLPRVRITGGPSAYNAHNSVLNVASELGIPAALVACVYLVGAVSNAARLYEKTASTFSCFALLFLVSFAILGFGEAHLLQIHSLFWILFVAITIAVEGAHAERAPASQR
jgi:exopolysaccharide production protein ExoQ